VAGNEAPGGRLAQQEADGLASATTGPLAPLYFVAKPAAWLIPAGRFSGHLVNGIAGVRLPHSGSAHRFEGHLYGDADVSFFISDTPPGKGPSLHTHQYAEVFVIQEGELTFTVGETAIKATDGQIVVAPAGTPTSLSTPAWAGRGTWTSTPAGG
jgi:mannose-6-phosphate isomerase-like protein (cupin superfamily)